MRTLIVPFEMYKTGQTAEELAMLAKESNELVVAWFAGEYGAVAPYMVAYPGAVPRHIEGHWLLRRGIDPGDLIHMGTRMLREEEITVFRYRQATELMKWLLDPELRILDFSSLDAVVGWVEQMIEPRLHSYGNQIGVAERIIPMVFGAHGILPLGYIYPKRRQQLGIDERAYVVGRFVTFITAQNHVETTRALHECQRLVAEWRHAQYIVPGR